MRSFRLPEAVEKDKEEEEAAADRARAEDPSRNTLYKMTEKSPGKMTDKESINAANATL